MRITIVDLEWYNKLQFVPNPKCMKISSFHKQKNDIVTLAQDSYDLTLDYDYMYVVRENISSGSIPESIDLLSEKVFLIGEGLKFYSRYKEDIDEVMAACRPDYLLYPIIKDNVMSRANIVQFFSGGKLLDVFQDYHNTYRNKHYTYVVDRNFWDYSDEDIEKCGKRLEKDKTIVFRDEINLNAVLDSKIKTRILLKMHIDWSKAKFKIVFTNKQTIESFLNFVDKIPSGKRSFIKVRGEIVYHRDHFDSIIECMRDFSEYFQLLGIMKQKKVNIVVESPERIKSPYWFYFEDLEGWTKNNFHLSFVEYITRWLCYFKEIDLDTLLTNRILWTDDIFRLMYLFRDYPDLMNKIAFLRWDDNSLEYRDYHSLAVELL